MQLMELMRRVALSRILKLIWNAKSIGLMPTRCETWYLTIESWHRRSIRAVLEAASLYDKRLEELRAS